MLTSKYPPTVWEIAAALKERYHDFNHYNLKNPLDELLFIIFCSTKTGEASYRSTFRSLKETFPTHLRIAEASVEYIARPIVSGGLSNQKAKAIRKIKSMQINGVRLSWHSVKLSLSINEVSRNLTWYG